MPLLVVFNRLLLRRVGRPLGALLAAGLWLAAGLPARAQALGPPDTLAPVSEAMVRHYLARSLSVQALGPNSATEAQRVALATLYRECAEEHCDRPYAWSELHHEDPWSEGGRTDLNRAVPLCGFHHRRVHDPRYAAQIHTDESGRKVLRLRQR